ncbi:MAG: hypothetical protein JJE01_00545 [Gemmatimonadetes bacterium]|nr:hypothetical protein [Gemmatimonadota bacterium]
MIDILVALAFAGCIYGIARAMGWYPRFRTVAWWTVAVMFAIAAYGELTIARSGEATPSVGHLIPLVLLGGTLYLVGRGVEWYAGKAELGNSAAEVADSDAQVQSRFESTGEENLLFGLPIRS